MELSEETVFPASVGATSAAAVQGILWNDLRHPTGENQTTTLSPHRHYCPKKNEK